MNKRGKQALNFKVWFLVFSFSLFASVAGSADAIPTAEDIDPVAENGEDLDE